MIRTLRNPDRFLSAALKGLPDFIGAPYEFWVGGNAEVGTSVGQIRVTDFPNKDKVIYDLLHGYSDGGAGIVIRNTAYDNLQLF